MEGSTTAKSPKFTRKVRRGLFWIEQLLPGDTIQQMSDMGYKAPALKDAQAALAWIAANSISPDLVEAVEKLAEVVLDPSTPTVLDPAPCNDPDAPVNLSSGDDVDDLCVGDTCDGCGERGCEGDCQDEDDPDPDGRNVPVYGGDDEAEGGAGC